MIVNLLIFLIGLLVYGSYGLSGVAVLAVGTLVSYGAARLTERLRWAMWISVGANVLMLLFFRAQKLVGLSFAAPLGVSYFTLMLISYNVDVYRGKYPAERNLYRFASYVTYYPHLLMGPIEGYDRLVPNLFENRRMSLGGISAGALRFVWGLFKRLVIAARAGVIISAISADPETYRGGFALIAMLLYSVQLYCDFSGGMDMVLGGSEMLGIRLSENFDAPYLSESFQEFWRRWHMTLGAWLRNYVYIPLGGNRKGKLRKNINLVLTFLVSGLWHGSAYVLWGLFNGLFVCVGSRLKTRSPFVNRLGTCFLVSLLWCFYVWPDTVLALKMLASAFTVFNYSQVAAAIGTLGLALSDWIVMGIALVVMGILDAKRVTLLTGYRRLAPAVQTALVCLLTLIVLVFGMYGIGFNAGEFIYSQF